MDKKSTPLEAFKELLILNDVSTITPVPSLEKEDPIAFLEQTRKAYRNRDLRDIIEAALKEKNTELKRQNFNLLCNNGELREKCKDNDKKIKALEIIKEKEWLVEDILDAFTEDKDKTDLLKEVLQNKKEEKKESSTDIVLSKYAKYDEELDRDYMVYEVKFKDGHKEYVSRELFEILKSSTEIKND